MEKKTKTKKKRNPVITAFQRNAMAVQTAIDYRDFERDTVGSLRSRKYPSDKFNQYKDYFN